METKNIYKEDIMDLKKSIRCTDGTYVEGTSSHLCSLAYRYDNDFSDDSITEIMEFARAMKDRESELTMKWLLESRHEKKNGLEDLGQIKIDMYNNTCTEAISLDDINARCEIFRENDKVVISITGFDEQGTWTAANAYDIDSFLELEEGSLGRVIGETINGGTSYLEE